jgi:DNA-binding CsgD family transcriptional regulator
VTVPTVKTHLTRIFSKLGVRNRAELAALAAQIAQS